MARTRVKCEEVEALYARLAEINAIPFRDIQWTRRGKPLAVSEKTIDDWKFVGLCNTNFVEFNLKC